MVGDRTGTGTAMIGIYRAGTGTWYLDTNGTNGNGLYDGCGIDACIAWGGDVPVVGAW